MLTKRTCSLSDCNRPHDARGLCRFHYVRAARKNLLPFDWEHAPRKKASPEDRFWRFVDKNGPDFEGAPCWLWTGSLTVCGGYGQFYDGVGPVRAYCWSYENFVGAIPEGLELDHKCKTPACVQFAHLEPVTHKVNVLRGRAPAAEHARQTHCKFGHEFTPENTYPITRGQRRCKACRRARWLNGESARRRSGRAPTPISQVDAAGTVVGSYSQGVIIPPDHPVLAGTPAALRPCVATAP